jgi:hypothetical protein
LEDGQEGDLWEIGEEEENGVYEGREQDDGDKTGAEERPEEAVREEVDYSLDI